MTRKKTRLVVPDALDGAALASFLALGIAGLSRRKARILAGQGMVFADGRRLKKGDTVKAGQVIEVLGELPVAGWRPLPDASIRLNVVFENDRVAALDKPAGMATVPLQPHETGCLANGIAHAFPECTALGRSSQDAGLLGRLDTGTSGLVLAARTSEAFDALHQAQRKGKLKKYYLAVCIDARSRGSKREGGLIQSMMGWVASSKRCGTRTSGHSTQTVLAFLRTSPAPHANDFLDSLALPLPGGGPGRGVWTRIDLPLAASATADDRVVVADGKGRIRGRPSRAVTAYLVLAESRGLALVLARMSRGFRHQMRVHLASVGLPLASDPLYGRPDPRVPGGFLLHSWGLEAEGLEDILPPRIVAGLPRPLRSVIETF